jgi:hypothetical protein
VPAHELPGPLAGVVGDEGTGQLVAALVVEVFGTQYRPRLVGQQSVTFILQRRRPGRLVHLLVDILG